MKLSPWLAFLAALGLFVSAPLVGSVRAGSAVASDHHGGFGYSFGPQSEKELRREAIRRCREKSKYPDDVEIAVSTGSRGAGIILRYSAAGRQHIYAYVGADNGRQAYEHAAGGARGEGAEGSLEVVARWDDH